MKMSLAWLSGSKSCRTVIVIDGKDLAYASISSQGYIILSWKTKFQKRSIELGKSTEIYAVLKKDNDARVNNDAQFYAACAHEEVVRKKIALSYEGACLIMCQLPTDIHGTILENEFNLSIPARNKFLSMAPTGAFEHYAACAHENDQVLRNNFSLTTRFLLSTEQTALMRRMIFNDINGNGETKYVTFQKQPATAIHCTFLNADEKKLLTTLPQEFIDTDNQNPMQHVLEKLMICEHPSVSSKIVKTPVALFLHQLSVDTKSVNDLSTFFKSWYGISWSMQAGGVLLSMVLPSKTYIP